MLNLRWHDVWLQPKESSEKQGPESEEKKQEEGEEEKEKEERQKGEKIFLAAMNVDGQFERAMADLDELNDTDARRLLGWAAFNAKPPGV